MAKKNTTVEPPTMTAALVNGRMVEVPIADILLDPYALDVQGQDPAQAESYARDCLNMLKRGTLNAAFIPRLFPRVDGVFVWQGLTRRP